MNYLISQKKLTLFIVTLVYPIFLFAQYPVPTMQGNNGTNDIIFLDCSSLATLNFTSGYATQYQNGKYTWTLYKNGNQIAQQIQLLLCKTSCTPTCELPFASFFESPQSGAYQIRLQIKSYTLVGVGCSGVWIPVSNVFDFNSNIINVMRPDDGAECICGLPQNITVDCGAMFFHRHGFPPFSQANPYTARAVNNLTANCNIISNNQPVKFIAGNKISLTQGFRSGNNFRAYLDICNDGIIVQTTTNPDSSTPIIDQRIANNKKNSIESQDLVGYDSTFNKSEKAILDPVSIFPNPNNGKFILEKNSTVSADIYIYDSKGKLIFQKERIDATTIYIDISEYNSGIYLIKVVSGNTIFVKRVIRN